MVIFYKMEIVFNIKFHNVKINIYNKVIILILIIKELNFFQMLILKMDVKIVFQIKKDI